MPSRFHEAALRMLGVAHEADPVATKALEDRATAIGVTFPASFVEWYGMRGGVVWMKRIAGCDEPVQIAELELEDDGLLFMIENQGVCHWSVGLGPGDDPAVLVNVDGGGWQRCADRFSLFIEAKVWDAQALGEEHFGHRIMLGAQAEQLSASDLAFLRREFHEQLTTHGFSGANTYRFERDDARILIWDNEGQADWWLTASTFEHLTTLAKQLWRCSNLATSLYGLTAEGKAVVRTLRG